MNLCCLICVFSSIITSTICSVSNRQENNNYRLKGTVPRYLFDDCKKDIMWEIDESGLVRHSLCICNAPSCTSRKIPTPPNRGGKVTKIQPRLKRLLPKNWGKRSKKWKEDQVVARRRSAHKKVKHNRKIVGRKSRVHYKTRDHKSKSKSKIEFEKA